MEFFVLPRNSRPHYPPAEVFYLIEDNWNDYSYVTTHRLVYIDDAGDRFDIGNVKIGEFGMKIGRRKPKLSSEFERLSGHQFSLGQDSSYYENLSKIHKLDIVLDALNDLAKTPSLFDRAIKEDVTKKSLLRDVSPTSVRGQFYRLANGQQSLSEYKFVYTGPSKRPLELEFQVEPDSAIPTNIHVIIGTNGVGKTTLLYDMARSLLPKTRNAGDFSFINELDAKARFSGVVSVSFSAFDIIEPLREEEDRPSAVRYAYVGLKKISEKNEGKIITKGVNTLDVEFASSLQACQRGGKEVRWKKAIESLQRGLSFHNVNLSGLIDIQRITELKKQAKEAFHELSSGHKIILLTITRLIEVVEEKTLVLIDEPEAHLHPPLLSALIRVIAELLTEKNGVAIIATHSPVVLQEVPKRCVWILRRSGSITVAERPVNETFGENVGELTRQVFQLEVDSTGFHALLAEAVRESDNYADIVRQFGGSLGAEAKMLVRALLAVKKNTQND